MNKQIYHATLKAMQEGGVNPQYAHGWASGALANPELEEQRISDAYSQGYEDGANGVADGWRQWVAQQSA